MIKRKKNGFVVCTLLMAALIAGISGASFAGPLSVEVTDDDGRVLANAVVSLSPTFQLSQPLQELNRAEMRQENTLFAPFVLPVRTGTRVSFPNFDEARHHVYSFSKARTFELRLYGKDETNAIEFDQAGVVALGCNIHDNMLAYIYVTDAPIYGTTDEQGRADFPNLENGDYQITVWHPGVRKNGAPEPVNLTIGDTNAKQKLAVRLRRVWGQQRPPADGQY